MQTATAPLTDGIFEELFPLGRFASAFVDLSQLEPDPPQRAAWEPNAWEPNAWEPNAWERRHPACTGAAGILPAPAFAGTSVQAAGAGRMPAAPVQAGCLRSQVALGLTPAEGRFFSKLRVEKRRRDWLGGRLAAKRAIVRLAQKGAFDWRPRFLTDVEVLPSETREPVVYSAEEGLPAPVQVSISHSGQFAGAVACRSDQARVGFDMEGAGVIDPALYALAFRDSEIREIEAVEPGLRQVAVLVLWTAKEAISKAIGTGLSICLQDIGLTLPGGLFSGYPGAEPCSASLRNGGPRLTVHTCRRGNYILSLARVVEVED